jgi:hypothetical protein
MASNSVHGKNAVIYLAASASGSPVLLGDQLSWSIDFDQAIVDTSPLNNKWKTHVKGMIGWSMACAGNFDRASKVLWDASIVDEAVPMYLYPTSLHMSLFYYGTCWVSLGKVAEGSTTSKASSSWKGTGEGELSCQ